MAAQGEATLPQTRRTRRSMGGGPPTRRSLDKENAAADADSGAGGARKKSRSKSMGPGGLDVFKKGSGNRRASLAVPTPRSILKPTIPLIPEIPSFKPKHTPDTNGAANDAGGTKVALRTEEEQQAAAREREERERAEMEKEISDRREARRKSLANRRVSFAAEATLHTFHEIEYMQDSTTSTDSTRRASSVTGQSPGSQAQQGPGSGAATTTPPDHANDRARESPAHQKNVQQKKRRRSSAASSMYGSDDTVASTVYDSDLEHADSVAEVQTVEMTGSSDESDEEDGTVMTVEAEEMTSASVASGRSTFSSDSTGSLDENLRLAARRAVTQSLGDEEEVIAGFAGWGRKNRSQDSTAEGDVKDSGASNARTEGVEHQGSDAEMDMDMDMTSAVGGIVRGRPASPDKEEEVDEDMSMDVTTALGGILSKAKAFLRRKSVNINSQAEPDELGEQSMEFTTAVGGIQQGRVSDAGHSDPDGNEDMSMEFTTAVGGLLSRALPQIGAQASRRQTMAPGDDDEGAMMDMTVGVGRILPTAGDMEEDEDQTIGMDMTAAVGGIIKPAVTPEARSAARKVMEQEADNPDHSATTAELAASPKRQAPATVDENLNPGLSAFQGKGLRRTPPRAVSPVARSPAPPSSSPMRRTPSPRRYTGPGERSPARTPPSMTGSRSSSPMRNLSSPAKPPPRSPTRPRLFQQDPSTGLSTPRVVLTPQGRRLSGVGADRPGLGSPRVAEIFDRRESIGEAATDFLPSEPSNPRRNVAFADPRVLEAEIDRERDGEQDFDEEGRDQDHEVTLNLREMIQGLSPKKNPLRGRKSLHVGSAVGLLGKRPVELDDDEDSEEPDGVKRLKGHHGSPVKTIRLQSPPSKAETTTGRKTRPSIRPMGADNGTPIAGSPQRATTPRGQNRAADTGNDRSSSTPNLESDFPMDEPEAQQQDDEGERIHLQDFLNMTSIRFMELTTTKRRHTVAPSLRESTAAERDDLSLERCVVAGACTVPMLELYQHSCRELKKYISEGRRIVREIETETFEENPPLFREYMTASPELKVLMDNQFKNVKTHARLLSKAMWYEWRMKLQDGLKEGLLKTAEGMDNDERLLAKQQELLASVLPGMARRLESLERERENLEALERELADCDPKDLEDARSELAAVGRSIAEKSKMVSELRQELDESVEGVDALTQQKQECLDAIREADRIREEYRGWSSEDIRKVKAQTEVIEKAHGWSVASISGTTIALRYRREIELAFDAALGFSNRATQSTANPRQKQSQLQQQQQQQQPSPVFDLRYVAECPFPLPPVKTFFLHRIRQHLLHRLRSTADARPVRPSSVLRAVAAAWDRAGVVDEQIRRLNLSFPTTVATTSPAAATGGGDGLDDGDEAGGEGDDSLDVTASVLLVPVQTRIEVAFRLSVAAGGGRGEHDGLEIEVGVEPRARVVYGEGFNVAKMREFLKGKVGGSVSGDDGKGAGWWDEAVLELYRKLLAKVRQK